jgi:hypothetical protein
VKPDLTPADVVRGLAALIACEDRAVADRMAADLPPFLELVDAVRASDGAMQLAQSLDARRRALAVTPSR